jgi:chromosome segregation ATPase
VNGKPRRVPGEDDESEGSAEYRTKSAMPGASSEGEVARLVLDRLVGLERQLSATLAAQTERDQRLAQLTDELTLKSALLEHTETNAAEATKRAGLELREHADRLSELEQQLSATLTAQTVRDQRLAQLTDGLALKSALLEQAEANAAEVRKHARLEPREHADRLPAQTPLVEPKDAELVNMQAKLDELLVSRDKAQSAMQKAISRAADADERSHRACEQIGQYETELAEVRAELGERKSELEVVRSRLTEAENGWAKSKIEADTLRTLTTASLVSTDEDRITRGLVERMRAMEAEMAFVEREKLRSAGVS